MYEVLKKAKSTIIQFSNKDKVSNTLKLSEILLENNTYERHEIGISHLDADYLIVDVDLKVINFKRCYIKNVEFVSDVNVIQINTSQFDNMKVKNTLQYFKASYFICYDMYIHSIKRGNIQLYRTNIYYMQCKSILVKITSKNSQILLSNILTVSQHSLSEKNKEDNTFLYSTNGNLSNNQCIIMNGKFIEIENFSYKCAKQVDKITHTTIHMKDEDRKSVIESLSVILPYLI